MQNDVIEDIRIPSDWGLEMGGFLRYSVTMRATKCHIDVADTHDHKHQDLSLEDRSRVLQNELGITKSLYRKMYRDRFFLTNRYARLKLPITGLALDLIESYNSDAALMAKIRRHTEVLP